jgi:hypothetical protein
MHEVRDRDYFFLLSFSLWGLWAGMGLVDVRERAAAALGGWRVRTQGPTPGRPTATRWPAAATRWPAAARLLTAPILLLALLPLALNWRWASRSDDWTARDWAYNVLMSVEPYGVLVTNGDNDSFPLWYAQNVEGIRTDVAIVLSPYLQTAWYARQLRDATRPCPPGIDPEASPDVITCQRAFRADRMPVALAQAGLDRNAAPPEDSILPLGDEQIERIAAAPIFARQPLRLAAGRLRTTIPAGTVLQPSDTFVAAILQSSLGRRPIHFMTPAPVLERLGLTAYTVREGLTWRLSDGPVAAQAGRRIVPLPPGPERAVLGAYVDLTRGATLADEVWLRRGRVADPRAPWVDSANASIPYNYAYAFYALAEAHAQLGEDAGAHRRAAQAAAWTRQVN